MVKKAENRIFVYGSLRKDFNHSMFSLLEMNGVFIGEAHYRGKLYEIDWYPGVVPSDDAGDRVTGEVYRVDNQWEDVIGQLDQYEGCSPNDTEPHLFKRHQETVTLKTGITIKAWIYLYNRPAKGKQLIPSGDYLEWKRSG